MVRRIFQALERHGHGLSMASWATWHIRGLYLTWCRAVWGRNKRNIAREAETIFKRGAFRDNCQQSDSGFLVYLWYQVSQD